MNCLSLLFASATQGTTNAFAAGSASPPASASLGRPALPALEAAQSAWDHQGGGPDDYLLPSGIASLEHWLDLNG